MRLIQWLCVLGAIASVLSAPTPEEDVDYHLPKTVTPSNYKLTLTLADNVFESNDNNAFQGTVEITLATSENTGKIQLNHRKLTLKTASIQDITDSTNPGEVVPIEKLDTYNAVTEIVTLAATLETGKQYLLKIEFEGTLETVTMDGFYKSSYTNTDNKIEYLATTQFESTSARAAFPSFDEPDFKATFEIIVQSPTGYSVLSNMPEDTTPTATTHIFKKSPKMSTYLVAFIISKFQCNPNSASAVEVCTRPAVLSLTKLAGEAGFKALDSMKQLTGLDYYDTTNYDGPGKMTEVAIPDFAAGAMENWGLVTYREVELLFDEQESPDIYKQRVVTVVTHEFGHQWFGDLVTLDWWSNVFLNEGFATYCEYHVSDIGYPELDLPNQFVVDEVQTALDFDTSKSVLALSSDVQDPDSISNRFDSISYNKGGSVLRMVEKFLTLDVFKTGLNTYLKAKNHANSVPKDLWDSFKPAASALPKDTDLNTVMDSWITKPGYPIVTVTSDETGVHLHQEPFARPDDKTTWYVPITYTTSTGVNAAVTWLTEQNGTIENLPESYDWIVVNNDEAGYYRVNYDDALWANISAALKKSVTSISELNRAQIIDDHFNFAKFNIKSYIDVLEFTTFLENEVSYYPWVSAFNGYNFLFKRINDEKLRTALTENLKHLVDKLYQANKIGATPASHIAKLTQGLALTWAGKLNIEDSVNKTKELFAAYIADPVKGRVEPNLRTSVYCNGLRYSETVKDDHQKLYEQYAKTDLASEQMIIAAALGCASDVDVLKSYLQQVISSDSKIRVQDGKAAITSVLTGNPSNVDVVLDFLVSNYDQINTRFGDKKTFNSILTSTVDRITNNGQSDKIDTFAKISTLDQSTKDALERGTESIKTNLEVVSNLEKDVRTFLNLNSASLNGAMFSVTVFIALAIALMGMW